MRKQKDTGSVPVGGGQALQAKQQELLDRMSPGIRKEVKWIQSWSQKYTSETIRGHHELGLRFKKIHDEMAGDGAERYGANAVERMCDAFAWDRTAMYDAMKVATVYTRDQIEEFCKVRMENGRPLTYTHVKLLAGLEDPAERSRLLDQVVRESLSGALLARVVRSQHEGDKGETRGRPLAEPKSLDGVIQQQEASASDFLNRSEKVWETEQHSLLAKTDQLPIEDISEEWITKLKAHQAVLLRLAETARLRAEEITRAIDRLEEKRTKQQSQSGVPAAPASEAGDSSTEALPTGAPDVPAAEKKTAASENGKGRKKKTTRRRPSTKRAGARAGRQANAGQGHQAKVA